MTMILMFTWIYLYFIHAGEEVRFSRWICFQIKLHLTIFTCQLIVYIPPKMSLGPAGASLDPDQAENFEDVRFHPWD